MEASMSLNQKHEPIVLNQINRKTVQLLAKSNKKWFNKALREQRQPVLFTD